MKNFEKYKDYLTKAIALCNSDELLELAGIDPNADYKASTYYYAIKKNLVDWLLQDYKEPILDEGERKYLSDVIRPFRNKIDTISKFNTFDDRQYIYIGMKDRRWSNLPCFPKGTMYKGMEDGKHYSPKELGL